MIKSWATQYLHQIFREIRLPKTKHAHRPYKQKSMAATEEKRPVGRPRFLTDSGKKKAKSERNKRYLYRTKIYLGDQYERWQAKKEELGVTHAGLAKILLNRFFLKF